MSRTSAKIGVLRNNNRTRSTCLLLGLMVVYLLAGTGLQAATPNSVTLTWTAPGDDGDQGTASQYDVRYSTSLITEANWASATSVTGVPTPQSAGTTETLTVTGLEPSTTYYFGLKVADEVPNWSALSNVIARTTEAENTPPAAIAGLTVNGISENSLTLSWVAPGDDGNSGTASQYDIRYSTSMINTGNWVSATQVIGEPSPQAAGSNESFTVTGLVENTTYYFAIMTADEVPNWSELSNVASGATTLETTAPAAIAGLDIVSETENSLTLGWIAPGDDGNSGTASQYDIRYSTSVITEATWDAAVQVVDEPVPQAAGSSETFTVTGLNESTTYYFAIKTADEVPNWSGLSNVASGATTAETTPPAALADLVAGNPTESTIDLTWTAPGDDGNSGTASQYDIRYSTSVINNGNFSSATPISGLPAPQAAGSTEEITVNGLELSTVYFFAIKTVDDVGNWSDLSNVASESTTGDQTPPAAIVDLNSVD